MDYLLELFGGTPLNGITVGLIIVAIGASVFLYRTYNKFKNMIICDYKEKEARDKKIDETFDQVKQYHEFRLRDREQSLKIQKQLTDSIEGLHRSQEDGTNKLIELEKKIIEYELSNSRDRLMSAYRYFTSSKHNPAHAWTELEKESWDELYKTYEKSGGNSYMHSHVKPEMETLTIIPMSDSDAIAELMHSRN